MYRHKNEQETTFKTVLNVPLTASSRHYAQSLLVSFHLILSASCHVAVSTAPVLSVSTLGSTGYELSRAEREGDGAPGFQTRWSVSRTQVLKHLPLTAVCPFGESDNQP